MDAPDLVDLGGVLASAAVEEPQLQQLDVPAHQIPELVFNHFSAGNDHMDLEEFERMLQFPEMQSHQRHLLKQSERREAFIRIASHSVAGAPEAGLLSRERWLAWCRGPAPNQQDQDRVAFQLRHLWSHVREPQVPEALVRFGSEPTFYCPTCRDFEICKPPGAFQAQACGHWYCRDCILEFFRQRVLLNQLHPKCFQEDVEASKTCDIEFPEDDILRVLSPEEGAKFLRFKQQKLQPGLRHCPACEHPQVGDAEDPAMVCEKCQAPYCFWHATAHPGMACGEYEKRNRKELRKTEALLRKDTRPCPRCHVPITKSEGCSHCRCAYCGCSFCWLCMTEIEDIPRPRHYIFDPENPNNPCANRQFDDPGEAGRAQLKGWRKGVFLCCLVLAGIPFAALVLPISLAVFLLCGLLFGLFVGPWLLRADRGRWRTAYTHIMTLAFIVGTCVFLLALGVLVIPGILCLGRCGCLPPANREEPVEQDVLDEVAAAEAQALQMAMDAAPPPPPQVELV